METREALGRTGAEDKRQPGKRRKNVLLIVADQWRGDCLHVAGDRVVRTPNIDRLCAEGVTFLRHYSQTIPCGPSRVSLLTGLYQMNHRAVQNTVPLDDRHRNLSDMLRDAGYDPVMVGYTTTTPDPRSTEHTDPRFSSLGDMMRGWRGIAQFDPEMAEYFAWVRSKGFKLPDNPRDIWQPSTGQIERGATAAPNGIPAELSDTSYFTERALSHLEGRGDRPWFMHLGYWRPHPPYGAPAPYHDRYDPADMPAPRRARTPEEEARQHPLLDFYIRTTPKAMFFQGASGLTADLTAAEVRQTRATYYGLMEEVDDNIGRVLDWLDRTGQRDDTLIIFTSDHAEQMGDHYLFGKVGYFDESYHIPMVICDPGPDAAGSRGRVVSAFTEAIDCVPTIVDWLQAKPERSLDGRSLLPWCRGGTPADWRSHVRYEYDFRDVYYSKPEADLGLHMDQCSLAVIQDEDFKYVHFAALPPLFFDMRRDPFQFENLANNAAYASRIRDYAQAMLSWRLNFAERTLTGYRASPEGLIVRQ
jgi:arylsulfatase A-like enzyme